MKAVYILISIFVALVLVFMLTKPDVEKYTHNSTLKEDKYIPVWHNAIFLPNLDKKINYNITYHNIVDYPYYENSFNILLDGEPRNNTDIETDLVISTKKVNLPNKPMIYAPYYAFVFRQLNIDPELVFNKSPIYPKTKFCCFAYSNCDEKYEGVRNRKFFLEKMIEKFGSKVENIGRCYNKNYKQNSGFEDNITLFKPYKFVIAFENEPLEGYVSEKLLMPLLAGCIPIYLGAPDVSLYFNTKRFVDVGMLGLDKTLEYINEIENTPNLYQQILNEPCLSMDEQTKNDIFSVYYGGHLYRRLFELLPVDIAKYIRPCQLYKNNFIFITFADESIYKSDRILREAENSRFFKVCKAYSPDDFDTDFKNKHEAFIKANKRGYGYWLWKPYFILKTLAKYKEGDVVVFCDSGSSINLQGYERFGEYCALIQSWEAICYQIKHIEKSWNKKDTIDAVLNIMDKPGYYEVCETNQITASFLMVKKCERMMNLISTWYNLACNYHLIDDSKSLNPNYPEFKEHRHDQAILSLLLKLNRNTLILNDCFSDEKEETTFLHQGVKRFKPFTPSRKK